MNILLITDEVWNDNLYTNNVLTNWFDGLSVNLANLYLAAGIPDNPCCRKYFQITDGMMIKSIVSCEKAGREFIQGEEKLLDVNSLEESPFVIDFLKIHPLETFRLIKDLIWIKGQIDIDLLIKFLQDFKPDIIFSLRMASLKVLTIERLVAQLAKVPLVCFTGDDEYTLGQLRLSPIFWIRRVLLRKDLRHTIKYYEKYYTLSQEQASLYKKSFGIDTKVLMKCSDIKGVFKPKEIHKPIRLIYAGRLYCNRYKTLILIRKALEKINRYQVEMTLEIYTKDKISNRRRKLLSDGVNTFLNKSVLAKELEVIYKEGDIVLHVESFDLKMKLLTKFSFSTKIIDCLASTCSVIAIGPKRNEGVKYLKNRKAAICITKPSDIERTFSKIAEKKDGLIKYQKRAFACVKNYHSKAVVQKDLLKDLMKIVDDFNKSLANN